MSKTWLEIIKNELVSAIAVSGVAITGAKLRSRVAKAAKAEGIDFPPPEMGKFSAFVESFAADFIVQRNPGSDILVAPADRTDLLAPDAAQSKHSRLRQDLFTALTSVGNTRGTAYYLPETDSVAWFALGEVVPKSAIKLPEASLEKELDARRKFITDEVKGDDLQRNMTDALAGPSPLRIFGEVIRAHGLVKDWHQFRMGHLTAVLREWSVSSALPWQPAWVEATNFLPTPPPPPAATPVSHDSRHQLALLADSLTTDDLARITVPLDIVLRLLAR